MRVIQNEVLFEMLEDSDVLSGFFSSLLQGSNSSDLLDHLRSIWPPQTVSCGGLLFRWVGIDARKNNKKEKLKMGRRKRHQSWGKRQIELTGRAPVRATKKAGARAMPSQRAKMDGDILRRDDVMNVDKTRWERISKFSLKKILGPEGDQL